MKNEFTYEVKVYCKKYHEFDRWLFLSDSTKHAVALALKWAKIQKVSVEIYEVKKVTL